MYVKFKNLIKLSVALRLFSTFKGFDKDHLHNLRIDHIVEDATLDK